MSHDELYQSPALTEDQREAERRAGRRAFARMTPSEQKVRMGLDALEVAGFTPTQALAILEAAVTFATAPTPEPPAPKHPTMPQFALPDLPIEDFKPAPKASPLLEIASAILPVLAGVFTAKAGLNLFKKAAERPLTMKEKLREILDVVLD